MATRRHRDNRIGIITVLTGRRKWLLILTVLVGSAILVFGLNGRGASTLPVYSPTDFNADLVDPSLESRNTPHQVGPFSLINQYGDTITEKDYRDVVFVTDFFFTRCPTICPQMTRNMSRIQEATKDLEVKLLSISVTPVYDSVPVLRDYALKHHADPARWHITTGDKEHIYNLARKEFFAAYDQSDGALQDFIHTSNFILADRNRQIRGIYDGTNTDEVNQLIADIDLLARKSD